jgi:hypothetical protein
MVIGFTPAPVNMGPTAEALVWSRLFRDADARMLREYAEDRCPGRRSDTEAGTRTAMMTRPWQTLRSPGEVCGKDRGARRGASGRGQEAKARQYSRRRAANSVLRRRCPCCWAGACSCVS